MNFMPKTKDQLLSNAKNPLVPAGIYSAVVLKEESDKNNNNDDLLKLSCEFTDQQGNKYIKTINLCHNEHGYWKVYKYCHATNRDYFIGQLKNLKGDKFWIEFGQYLNKWTDKEGKERSTMMNSIRDIMTAVEASEAINTLKAMQEMDKMNAPKEAVDTNFNDEIPF